MIALLADCKNKEQREMIQFIFSDGIKGPEIDPRNTAQYWERPMLLQTSVFKWHKKFKSGKTTLMQEGADHLPMSTTYEKTERMHYP